MENLLAPWLFVKAGREVGRATYMIEARRMFEELLKVNSPLFKLGSREIKTGQVGRLKLGMSGS